MFKLVAGVFTISLGVAMLFASFYFLFIDRDREYKRVGFGGVLMAAFLTVGYKWASEGWADIKEEKVRKKRRKKERRLEAARDEKGKKARLRRKREEKSRPRDDDDDE